jgi:hypothetical protein
VMTARDSQLIAIVPQCPAMPLGTRRYARSAIDSPEARWRTAHLPISAIAIPATTGDDGQRGATTAQ